MTMDASPIQKQPNLNNATSSKEVVELFWQRIGDGRYTSTLELFGENAVYYDMLYDKPFEGKVAIGTHLANMESAMPKNVLNFVLDDVASSPNKVGARWHVETKQGKTIPFGRGASFYTLGTDDTGNLLFESAWDFPEYPLKVAGFILPLLRLASRFLK